MTRSSTRSSTRSASAFGLGSALATLALMLSTTASAAVITFDGLTGTTGDPLGVYSENGFTVTPTLGAWKEFHVFGQPIPSIHVADLGDVPFGNLEIAAGGGLFIFNSLDLQAFYSGVDYEIRGSRRGTVLFSVASSQAGTLDFQTLTGGGSVVIDTLTFDISSGGPGAFNVDNINVTAVPEPTACLLLLSGLGLLGAIRQRH